MSTKNSFYDYVYIEDTPIFRRDWKIKAQEKKKNVLILESVDEFDLHTDKISKETTSIHIDSDLGKNIPPGELFAVKLHNDGYKKIFMASCHSSSHFAHIPWIKNLGKTPPFYSEIEEYDEKQIKYSKIKNCKNKADENDEKSRYKKAY